MLLIFLDTETTGCNLEKHRAIEIAFKIFDVALSRVVSSYESIIYQPAEVWAEADLESSKIHGFNYESTLKGKSEKVVEGEITTYLNHVNVAEKSAAFICQNPSFDRAFFCKIVSVELQKKYRWPYHWLDLASMYWTLRNFQNKNDASRMKEEDLSKDKIASYFHLPKENIPHRAMNGVDHLMLCYEAIMKAQIPAHAKGASEH